MNQMALFLALLAAMFATLLVPASSSDVLVVRGREGLESDSSLVCLERSRPLSRESRRREQTEEGTRSREFDSIASREGQRGERHFGEGMERRRRYEHGRQEDSLDVFPRREYGGRQRDEERDEIDQLSRRQDREQREHLGYDMIVDSRRGERNEERRWRGDSTRERDGEREWRGASTRDEGRRFECQEVERDATRGGRQDQERRMGRHAANERIESEYEREGRRARRIRPLLVA